MHQHMLIASAHWRPTTASIQTGHKLGMQLLDDHLYKLWEDGTVEKREALLKSNMPEELAAKIAQAERGMFEGEGEGGKKSD